MSTLDDLNAGPGGLAGLVGSLSRRLRPASRRDVLVGATVAATALATKPKEYALRPVAAYATICGPGNTASSGWTVFCATVNNGVNACPPGSFAASSVKTLPFEASTRTFAVVSVKKAMRSPSSPLKVSVD